MPTLLLIILIAIAVYSVGIYNSLITQKNRIKASIQEIGNQLKRQFDLIPNLEESAKSYLKHEKSILALLSEARKSVQSAVGSGNVSDMASAGQKVADLLPKLQVIVESNPQIKGSEVISKLMDELRDTSDKVMYSRRTLIDLTADYNIAISAFPSKIVADLFGFKTEAGLTTPAEGDFLRVEKEQTQTPKIKIG